MEITKKEFLAKFPQFEGNDEDGYEYPSVSLDPTQLSEFSGGSIEDIEALEEVLEEPDDNEETILELNNAIMSKVFGDGESFQGSFEETQGSGDYDWYLDFGNITIDEDYNVHYSGVRFYKG